MSDKPISIAIYSLQRRTTCEYLFFNLHVFPQQVVAELDTLKQCRFRISKEIYGKEISDAKKKSPKRKSADKDGKSSKSSLLSLHHKKRDKEKSPEPRAPERSVTSPQHVDTTSHRGGDGGGGHAPCQISPASVLSHITAPATSADPSSAAAKDRDSTTDDESGLMTRKQLYNPFDSDDENSGQNRGDSSAKKRTVRTKKSSTSSSAAEPCSRDNANKRNSAHTQNAIKSTTSQSSSEAKTTETIFSPTRVSPPKLVKLETANQRNRDNVTSSEVNRHRTSSSSESESADQSQVLCCIPIRSTCTCIYFTNKKNHGMYVYFA